MPETAEEAVFKVFIELLFAVCKNIPEVRYFGDDLSEVFFTETEFLGEVLLLPALPVILYPCLLLGAHVVLNFDISPDLPLSPESQNLQLLFKGDQTAVCLLPEGPLESANLVDSQDMVSGIIVVGTVLAQQLQLGDELEGGQVFDPVPLCRR